MGVLFVAPSAIRAMRQRSSRRLPHKPKTVTTKSRRVTSRAPLLAGAAFVFVAGVILSVITYRKRAEKEDEMKWAPVHGVTEISSRPHSENAFTQGLVWAQGGLWESTGLVGMSRVRKLGDNSAATESIAESYNPGDEFGEGLARFDADGSKLVQLTWRNEIANVWDTTGGSKPQISSSFRLPGERWGIAASDDANLWYVSDGTPFISVLRRNTSDETTFDPRPVRTIRVTDGGRLIHLLNELEVIRGELWANVWMSNLIARVNTRTGRVMGWLDCSHLEPRQYASPGHQMDVLNGIAYDRERDKVYVTGKLWPRIFEIKPDWSQTWGLPVIAANPFFMDEEKVKQIMESTMP